MYLIVRPDQGLSGAWVVKDQKFCGVIYVAYHRTPYLHMIPAHDMSVDICAALKLPVSLGVVKVAGFNTDVEDYARPVSREVASQSRQEIRFFWTPPELSQDHDGKTRWTIEIWDLSGIVVPLAIAAAARTRLEN
jgi:hypothetical protein